MSELWKAEGYDDLRDDLDAANAQLDQLRAENERLRAALSEYADRENWYRVGTKGMNVFDCGSDDTRGWVIADAALSDGKGETP